MNDLSDLFKHILLCTACSDLIDSRLYAMGHYCGKSAIRLCVIGINPGPASNKDRALLNVKEFSFEGHYEDGLKRSKMGIFISECSNKLGISWDNIFFTNVIKCSTPNCRFPKNNEIVNCYPNLEKQLELAKSSNYLILGPWVADTLKLNFKANTIQDINGKRFIYIYHPSYVYRSDLAWQTFEFLKGITLI